MNRSLRLMTPLLLVTSIALTAGCTTQRVDKSTPLASKSGARDAMNLAHLLRDNGRMAAAYGVYAKADQHGQLNADQTLEYAEVGAAILPAQDALPLFVLARQRLSGDRLSAEQQFSLCQGIGRGQLASSQWAGAMESFECALKAKADSTEAINGMAIVKSAQGQDSEAEALFNKALQLDPGNVAALNNLALNKIGQGQPKAAVDLLEGANLKGRPTLVLNLALSYLLLRDDDHAQQTLQRYMPGVRSEPLLADLKQNAQRILGGQSSARELLAASRQPLTLEAVQ